MLEVLFWSIVLTYLGLLKTYFSPGILKRRENYSQNKNWVLITTLSYSKSCGMSSSFIYQQHLTFDSTEKFCPINSIMCFISIFISGHFESLGVCPPSTKNRGAKKIPFDRKTFDSILIWWRLLLPIKNSRNIEKCSKISRLISFFAIYSVSNENPSDWESNFLWFFLFIFLLGCILFYCAFLQLWLLERVDQVIRTL